MNQGDVHWVDLPTPIGSSPGYRRPCVVVQNNAYNRSRIQTVIVCPTTTNQRLSRSPGNVHLDAGEANLPQRSIVNVSQIVTVDLSQVEVYIGTLSASRILQVIDGIRIVIEPS